MTSEVKVLSDDEVAEIEAGLAEYKTSLFRPLADTTEHDTTLQAQWEVEAHESVDALCATVRALRQQITELTAEWCECGHAKTQHRFFSDHDECYECDQMSDDLCCEWRPAPRVTDTYTALCEQLARCHDERWASQRLLTETQNQLAQVTQERDNLRSEANNRIVKLQEEIQILRHENQP